VSLAGFYKQVDNFVIIENVQTTVQDDFGGTSRTVKQPQNAGKGRIYGFELVDSTPSRVSGCRGWMAQVLRLTTPAPYPLPIRSRVSPPVPRSRASPRTPSRVLCSTNASASPPAPRIPGRASPSPMGSMAPPSRSRTRTMSVRPTRSSRPPMGSWMRRSVMTLTATSEFWPPRLT